MIRLQHRLHHLVFDVFVSGPIPTPILLILCICDIFNCVDEVNLYMTSLMESYEANLPHGTCKQTCLHIFLSRTTCFLLVVSLELEQNVFLYWLSETHLFF